MRKADLQELVERLSADGCAAKTMRLKRLTLLLLDAYLERHTG